MSNDTADRTYTYVILLNKTIVVELIYIVRVSSANLNLYLVWIHLGFLKI
jgi:hypothetical protein